MKLIVLFTLIVVSSCGPAYVSALYSGSSTTSLWLLQNSERDPLKLALIEAELGSRGETHFGTTSYLGKRTGGAVGQMLYTREDSSKQLKDIKNCNDFPSSAVAQKYFLAAGGPVRDPHRLDGDGDGLACEWGAHIKYTASKYRYAPAKRRTSRGRGSTGCYVGPRGGTYTITASGSKNYNGC